MAVAERCSSGGKMTKAEAESMGKCAVRFWNAIRSLQSRIALQLAEHGVPP
jgi:hypothetical protein